MNITTLKYALVTLALLPLISTQNAWAEAKEPHHQIAPMPKEFDTLKNFLGTWEGEAKMQGEMHKVTVSYELTSGGTAIKATMGAGTPHEMVNMIHRDGKSLGLTHYCAMGNQPYMSLTKAGENKLAFEMTKPKGIDSPSESHMHAVAISLFNKDTLHEEWVHYEDGKEASRTLFKYKKVALQ